MSNTDTIPSKERRMKTHTSVLLFSFLKMQLRVNSFKSKLQQLIQFYNQSYDDIRFVSIIF